MDILLKNEIFNESIDIESNLNYKCEMFTEIECFKNHFEKMEKSFDKYFHIRRLEILLNIFDKPWTYSPALCLIMNDDVDAATHEVVAVQESMIRFLIFKLSVFQLITIVFRYFSKIFLSH